ncbi:SGNH/GDSL hydrolase family protein [Microbacterium sp. YJN-G]|uniref:SGNH/GDSL hydrolase family protein n=1 Tax=Microbacterium sp. YJN-G TaxID=2763257 RepID=UPI001877C11C|nr:SGNH/GDSL hydrolase family protein [Microbacterium sp. YJN-G]
MSGTARGVDRRWRQPRSLAKLIALAVTSAATVGMVSFALLSSSADDKVEPPQAVFLGDSYTAGVGGDGVAWPTTVAGELGWTVVNLALGGTGYATESGPAGCGREHCGTFLEQSKAIEGAPRIIVVAGGRNDAADSIESAAYRLFTTLRAEHPGATVIALSPWADDDPVTEGLTAKITAVRRAAREAGIVYIDTGQPFVGHPGLISADGVHPNTAGYTKLSALLAPLLLDATQQSG